MRVLVLAVLVSLLVMSICPSVFAQTVQQAQQDVSRLQQNLDSAMERYKAACDKVEQTRGEIQVNRDELTKAEAELTANEARLNSRVRAMYVGNENRFLDVMVNSGSFDQFLVASDLSKRLSSADASLVSQVKDAKAKLEGQKANLQEKLGSQASAADELKASKAQVESDLSAAKGKLANVEEQVRQALARQQAEAAARASSSSSSGRKSYPSSPSSPDIVAPRTRPPGAPHGGVVGVAYDQLGKPYVWGAEGPDAFDCSGLTMYCYRVGAGIEISHSSYEQANCGVPVAPSELQPGDILGFRGWGHVGLYVGGGDFIQAPQTGDVVKVTSLASRSNFCGAVRP
jgi:cell wall-associated NlpC family hydrolase